MMTNLPTMPELQELLSETCRTILDEIHPERIWHTTYTPDGVDIYLLDTDGLVLSKAMWLRVDVEERIESLADEMIHHAESTQ